MVKNDDGVTEARPPTLGKGRRCPVSEAASRTRRAAAPRPVPGTHVPLCGHGGDPVRAFPSVTKGDAAPANALDADADTASAGCLDGGTSGRRIEVPPYRSTPAISTATTPPT